MHSNSSIEVLILLTSGQIAGIASKIFEHPFDLTKVRLQSQVLQPAESTRYRFTGPVDCLVKTWQNEGVRGLYRVSPSETNMYRSLTFCRDCRLPSSALWPKMHLYSSHIPNSKISSDGLRAHHTNLLYL